MGLEGKAVEVAQHRTQCRVLEGVIEHFPNKRIEKLVQELLDGAQSLCKHMYGNFIVQSILAYGTPVQRARIVDIVVADVCRLSKHKIGSNVVRAALLHGSTEERESIIHALPKDAKEYASIVRHKIGSFIAREVRLARKQ